MFRTQLDQVRATIAKLLCNNFRRAAMQVGRVHEGIKPAVGEWFHFVGRMTNKKAGCQRSWVQLDILLKSRAGGTPALLSAAASPT